MANIRIDLNHAPLDGETITFKAPCNANDITGLVVYYVNENEETASSEFTLNDANGGDIGIVDNIFSEGSIVKVILDTDINNAYVQNPDTNTYLEGKFEELKTYVDTVEALAAANKAAHEANAAAIALKASQADLEAAVARIVKNEADIAAFVEVSEEEINALFVATPSQTNSSILGEGTLGNIIL